MIQKKLSRDALFLPSTIHHPQSTIHMRVTPIEPYKDLSGKVNQHSDFYFTTDKSGIVHAKKINN